jgi:hypothetical protein
MAARGSGGFSFEKLEERALLSAALSHAGVASLAYDSSGMLYAAYCDDVTMNLKFVTRDANGHWSDVTTLDSAAGAGTQLSLALDLQGRPGVAYYDAAKRDLKYAHFDGSNWSKVTVDSAGKVGRNPSLVFDSADHPMISYYSTTAMDLKLAAFSGRRWSVQTIDAGGNVGRFSSLAINPTDGSWAIAYESATDHEVKIALRRKKTFSIGVIAEMNDAVNWGSKPSLVFDAGDHEAVSYGDPAGNKIVLARISGKHWNASTAASGAGLGSDIALSFDSRDGSARIVYLSQAGEVNVAAFGGGTWGVTDLGAGVCVSAAENPVTHSLSFVSDDGLDGIDTGLVAATNVTAGMSMDDPEWMNVHWTDNSSSETHYRIKRSTNGVNFSTIDIVPANSNDYDDQEVSLDTTYYYRVTPFNTANNGPASAAASGTSWISSPNGLRAVVVSSGEIDLSWSNASTTATKLSIHCVDDSDDHNILDVALNLDPATESYQVTQLADGTPLAAGKAYSFWIEAARPDTYNASADATGVTAFATPTNLYVSGVSASEMVMTWSDVLGEYGYELQWSSDGTNFSTLATLPANMTNYDFSYLDEGSRYYFRVRALSSGGDSAFSQISESDTMLGRPLNVVATPLPDGMIQLNWVDASANEDSYDVEVAGPSGVWTLPIVLPAGTTSYLATQGPYGTLEPGLQYRFSVRALVGMGGASARGISGIITALG